MLSNLLKSIFGSRNDRLVKQYSKIVRAINELEAVISPLSDEALRNKTGEFKQPYAMVPKERNGKDYSGARGIIPIEYKVIRNSHTLFNETILSWFENSKCGVLGTTRTIIDIISTQYHEGKNTDQENR